MIGLLLQDLYLMKKNLIITSFICIYYLLILLCSGNLRSSEADFFIYMLCGIVPCFMTSCACFTMNSSRSSKSLLLIRTYPLDNITITLEKYVLTYTLLIFSYMIILFFAIVNHFFNSYNPDSNTIYICFLIFSVLFLFLNLQLPVILRFGQAVAAGVLIAVLCFGIVLALTVIVKIATTSELYDSVTSFLNKRAYIGILVLLADLLSMAGSFLISKALIET